MHNILTFQARFWPQDASLHFYVVRFEINFQTVGRVPHKLSHIIQMLAVRSLKCQSQLPSFVGAHPEADSAKTGLRFLLAIKRLKAHSLEVLNSDVVR